jgi:enoyl-[acyl-carrier protein] reductase I
MELKDHVAVVFGLANKRSIAWAIAQKLAEAGATLAICYQNERLRAEAEALTKELPNSSIFECDVASDSQIDAVFAQLKERYGKLDTLVHSVAFAPAEALHNDFLLTTRDGFRVAHEISCYSLIALARGAAPLMTDGGSIITMTYLGSQQVVPRYNVMGVAKAALEATVRYLAADLGPKKIRVNAISAGPLKTLAARGIGGLSEMMKVHAERAPLKRNVEPAEVGNAGLFLASDLSSGISGEVIYVDCGFNVMSFAMSEMEKG